MSFRGSGSDRGNLLQGSKAPHHPINIEHLGYSVLIGAVLKYFAVLEIATSPPEGRLLAMTVVVDDRQRLKNSTTN